MLNVKKMSGKAVICACVCTLILMSCGFITAMAGEAGNAELQHGRGSSITEVVIVNGSKVEASEDNSDRNIKYNYFQRSWK